MGIKPLPRTDRARREHFNPAMIVASRQHRVPLVPMSELIFKKASKTSGINMKIRIKAKKGLKKIESMYEGKKTLRDIRILQALFLDDLAARNADFAVNGLARVDALESTAKNEKIPNYENLTLKELKDKVWEKMFSKFILNFRNAIPQASDVIRTIQYIRRFTTFPLGVHFERKKHWNSISKIESDLLKEKVNPEENLKTEVKRVLKRTRNTQPMEHKKLARLRALDIIVASSIYADLLLETEGKPLVDKIAREQFWNDAYSSGMEQIYPLVADQKGLIRAVIEYNRESPKSKVPLTKSSQE